MRDKQRIRWVGACTVLLLAGRVASAADEPSALDYWPHEPGTAWVYATDQGQQRMGRVVGQERLNDETMTVIEEGASGAAPAGRTFYAIRDGQVLLVAQQKIGEPPHRQSVPAIVWPATTAMGTRWYSIPGNDRSPERVIDRQEQVSVPAGTYTALVIISYVKEVGITTTQWRAAGVGLLRSVTERLDGSRQSMELIRFEAPNSPPSQ